MISQWNCLELDRGKVVNHLKKPNNFDIYFPPLKEPAGVGKWNIHICLLPYPLDIYKDLYHRRDRGAQSVSQLTK